MKENLPVAVLKRLRELELASRVADQEVEREKASLKERKEEADEAHGELTAYIREIVDPEYIPLLKVATKVNEQTGEIEVA